MATTQADLDEKTDGNRTTFHEDEMHVATLIVQGNPKKSYVLVWWCVRFTGGHTGSKSEAVVAILKELNR